jgi:putative DNA primase/helicase
MTANNSVREHACDYLQYGWVPIKLKPRSKKPALESHDASTITWDNVSAVNSHDNIAIRFTRAGKIKDLDLDYQTAVDLAKEVGLIDATARFGRQSVGISHLLYDSPDCDAKKFQLPESNEYGKPLPIHDGAPSLMVLEIRGADGTYTMMPPSIHPDTGETVEWSGNVRQPLAVTAEELRKLAGLHAMASVVLYFYPENAATRYEVRMSLAGALIRSGVNADHVKKYVHAVARLGGDPRWDEDFVDHTEQRIENERTAFGLPKLIETLQLPKACEKTFREWLMIDAEGALVLDPQDPMSSARKLIADQFTTDDKRTLYRHRAAFWSWTGNYYMLADDEVVESRIWQFLEKAKVNVKVKVGEGEYESRIIPFKPNRNRVGNVVAALGAISQLDSFIEPPAWLVSETLPAKEFLACGNGLLHLPTGTLHSPSPSYFNLSASEVMFDPNAPEPVQWLAFLKQLFGDDQEQIQLLQDQFGYLISPDTSQQKILLIIGPMRSGKGTIGRVLTRLLGRDSVAGPTMSSLGESFGLEPLITKPLAIVSDMRIGVHTNKSMIAERLLSISGEDIMTVGRKFKPAWHGRLLTRFMILTNELPSFSDGSGALANRFVVLVLTKSFFGEEDPDLTDKLTTELSGILNWAIEGYRNLRGRGYFVQPQSSSSAIEEIEMLAAPVKAFIRDLCETGPDCSVNSDDLWGAYKQWCQWEGRRDAGTKAWFGRNLRSALPGLTVTNPRNERGRQVTTYNGVTLRSAVAPPPTNAPTQAPPTDTMADSEIPF